MVLLRLKLPRVPTGDDCFSPPAECVSCCRSCPCFLSGRAAACRSLRRQPPHAHCMGHFQAEANTGHASKASLQRTTAAGKPKFTPLSHPCRGRPATSGLTLSCWTPQVYGICWNPYESYKMNLTGKDGKKYSKTVYTSFVTYGRRHIKFWTWKPRVHDIQLQVLEIRRRCQSNSACMPTCRMNGNGRQRKRRARTARRSQRSTGRILADSEACQRRARSARL